MITLALATMLAPTMLTTQVRSTEVFQDYMAGDATCTAFVVTPATKKVHPVVYIVHDWDGLNAHEMRVAQRLGAMGYKAIAIDVYGKGVRPKNTAEASAESGKYYANSKLWLQRLEGALKNFTEPGVKQFAIGYCFGGASVLEMARHGMPLDGVASFHGSLQPVSGKLGSKMNVIAFHGADDPFVPLADVQAFEKEMKDAPFEFVSYPGAVHAFTVMGTDPALKGAKYNKNADEKSWTAFTAWLKRLS